MSNQLHDPSDLGDVFCKYITWLQVKSVFRWRLPARSIGNASEKSTYFFIFHNSEQKHLYALVVSFCTVSLKTVGPVQKKQHSSTFGMLLTLSSRVDPHFNTKNTPLFFTAIIFPNSMNRTVFVWKTLCLLQGRSSNCYVIKPNTFPV